MKQTFFRKTTASAAIALLCACTFLPASADDRTPIPADRLPARSRAFLQKHFAGKRPLLVVRERDFPDISYEVGYADGHKVEFRKDGRWKEVDCLQDTVPATIVPKTVADFVSAHYPNSYICKLERDRKGYEVKLGNRLELTFDLKFHLVEIDD